MSEYIKGHDYGNNSHESYSKYGFNNIFRNNELYRSDSESFYDEENKGDDMNKPLLDSDPEDPGVIRDSEFLLRSSVQRPDGQDIPRPGERPTMSEAGTLVMTHSNLLSSGIKPRDLVAKLQTYIGWSELDRDHVKLVLRQGADDNNIFMIREDTYDKMVDALDLGLGLSARSSASVLSLLSVSCGPGASGVLRISGGADLSRTVGRMAALLESRSRLKNKSLAAPPPPDNPGALSGFRPLASIRSRDSPDSGGTAHNEVSSAGSGSSDSAQAPLEGRPRSKCSGQTVARGFIVGCLLALSWVCFAAWALATRELKARVVTDIVGPPLMVARGMALAIAVISAILLLLVSYDLVTATRKWTARCCLTLLDFNVYFHKAWGYIVLVWSMVHTGVHLIVTFRQLSDEDKFTEIQDLIKNFQFDKSPSYLQLCFTTIPGITGFILIIAIILMWITSFEWIKRKHFQIFSFVHVTMFPTFMFGMIAHGGGRWFNFNFPFAAIPLAIPLLIYFTMIFMRVYAMCKNSFKVTNVSISSSKNFMHITLKVPKGYTWKSGQFAFINVPSVRKFEWHPFSIASSPNGKYLSFMIKRAGDWTGELIDKFYQTKKESFCIDKNLSNSERLKATISGICSEKYQDELRDFIMQMNLGNHDDVSNKEEFSNTNFLDLPISSKYPTINISKPISAPAEMAVKRKKIIWVGAGSGMAPFLALLDDQRVAAGGVRDTNGFLHESYNQEFDNVEKAHLIFTSRDSDTYSWLSPYMDKIMESDLFKNKIKLHVYLTGTKYNTLPSFVFWRAFILRQQQESNGLFTSPAHIQRPNFSKIFAKINSEDPGDFHVYVCAADCIVEEVEKACEEVYQRSGWHYHMKYEIF